MQRSAFFRSALLAVHLVVASTSVIYAQDEDLSDLGVKPRPGATSAEARVDFGEDGFYGLLAGVWATSDFHDTPGFGSGNGGGFDVRAGYRWHPNLSAELQYEWIEQVGDLDVWFLGGNGKAYLSSGRFQPFAIAGLGAYSVDGTDGSTIDDTAFGVRAGAGIDLYATKHVALGFEATYNFATGDLDDLRYTVLSLGLLLKL